MDGEAAIGFVCTDCRVRSDAAVVPTRDWYSYDLTTAGERQLLAGNLCSLRTTAASDAELFRGLVQHWADIQRRYGRAATVLSIAFEGAAEVRKNDGPALLALATRQVLEIVRGEMRSTDALIETADGMLVLMPETDQRSAQVPRKRLLGRITSSLALDLGVAIRVMQPRELLAHGAP